MGIAFRFFLIIVIVWYVVRYLIPALFGSPKKEEKPSSGGKEFRKSTKQGDVTITDFGKASKEKNSKEDDFVDFEELE